MMRIIIGSDSSYCEHELARASCSGEYCSWLRELTITWSVDSVWIANWIYGQITDIYYEPLHTPNLAFFQDSVYNGTIDVYTEAFLYGPTGLRTVSLSSDTALILFSQVEQFGWIDGSLLKLMTSEGDVFPPFEIVLPCTWSNLDFQRTHGGRLLIFSGIDDAFHPQYPHPRIVEVDTSGNCTELSTLDLNRDPDAIVWHPDYGFAALLVHPARIMLARVDTNGVEIQPLGIFWEPESGYRIAEANLRIANDGCVVVFWNEMDAQNLSTLKIGAVEWDTFLGVQEKRTVVLPEEMSLSVYPNPFNLSATISFELPQAGKVSVVIYDVTGRRVRLLANEYYGAGRQHLKFDATGFSSGIYFARLEANGNSVSKKLLLLK
ncbi:T9SS type A sorting domain-containing protein [bacterium]|nr:T9SS type A sorting domain-containing protein [bacterium]